jgi:hypothetical protein
MRISRNNEEHVKLVKEIASKIGKDRRVVNFVVSHFFHFFKLKVEDTNELRPFRWPYLCALAIRTGKKKK